MMIAVTQRVVIDSVTGERRDALDQNWTSFLHACQLTPLLIPNHPEAARDLMQLRTVRGVLLTGGNDLVDYGGDAPERDAIERFLMDEAEQSHLPVLGICRGMQLIQHRAGVSLQRIAGHVAVRHTLAVRAGNRDVNSYHRWGATETSPDLKVWATAADGVIEAVVHQSHQTAGIMWHPERERQFCPSDIALVQGFFSGEGVWQ